MPSLFRTNAGMRGAVGRPALVGALLLVLGALPAVAGAQDTTTAPKPVPAAARDTTAPVAPPAIILNVAGPAAPGAASSAPSTAFTVQPSGAPAVPAPKPAAATQAEPVNPDLANAFVQRAVTLYEQGKHEAALSEYRRGIAADPMDSDTWFGLAELLDELGRGKQAIETYTLALETIPHAPELRTPFAELLMKHRRKAEAIKVLQRGIELDPDVSDEMRSLLGNLVVGVLDESGEAPAAGPAAAPADSAAAPSAPATTTKAPAAKAAASKPKPKMERKKRKKLCNLFCPGTFTPVPPKAK